MSKLIVLIVFTVLAVSGCATQGIPSDVRYSVIDTQTMSDGKRAINVRLNKKVSEDVLTVLAHRLKRSSGSDRVLIFYYLPDMTVDTGAWATTHMNPDLVVNIQGMTDEQEKVTLARTQPPNRQIIGRWSDNAIGCVMIIYEESGNYFLEEHYKDGSIITVSLLQVTSRRYDKRGSRAGDRFIIDTDDNLLMHDNDGYIATATKAE